MKTLACTSLLTAFVLVGFYVRAEERFDPEFCRVALAKQNEGAVRDGLRSALERVGVKFEGHGTLLLRIQPRENLRADISLEQFVFRSPDQKLLPDVLSLEKKTNLVRLLNLNKRLERELSTLVSQEAKWVEYGFSITPGFRRNFLGERSYLYLGESLRVRDMVEDRWPDYSNFPDGYLNQSLRAGLFWSQASLLGPGDYEMVIDVSTFSLFAKPITSEATWSIFKTDKNGRHLVAKPPAPRELAQVLRAIYPLDDFKVSWKVRHIGNDILLEIAPGEFSEHQDKRFGWAYKRSLERR